MNTQTRSTVNEQQYAAPAFSKSGFPLSYKKYSSYMLGRLHVSGYQNCMPGDKISGQNTGDFTMKRMVTPMVAPIDVAQYNFFLPFRAIDRTFERAFAPSKENAMSASWSAPTVDTQDIVTKLLAGYANGNTYFDTLFGTIWYDSVNNTTITSACQTAFDTVISDAIASLTTGLLHKDAADLYIDDALLDIVALIESRFPLIGGHRVTTSDSTPDRFEQLLDCLLTPFVGRYSYYGEFKYKYVRPYDLYKISHGILDNQPDGTLATFLGLFDQMPLNEYPLRAMYVIWYEKFRNVDLEPVNSNLPYWKDFGSSSIITGTGGHLCHLLYRIRPWYEDMFTTAQIDDLSRHVWAPISTSADTGAAYHGDTLNLADVNSDSTSSVPAFVGGEGTPKPSIYNISWFDQVKGVDRSISCPVPTNINDILSSTDQQFTDVYGLDLNTLRQAQQLERYLKRNYLFGDEYQDRMLAHYNSRVSDMRINRPELLSMSLNGSDMKQEVANMSNGFSNAGDRTATGTLQASGDQYTTFCEEFGILINLISFMPQACYDGTQPQLLCSHVVDYPLPEFATNNEEFGRKLEIADTALSYGTGTENQFMFGRYPAYHAWRQRVDEVGGDFLDELQDCTFRRFWGMLNDDTTPKLNYYFIHCRPNLGMFANTVLYDAQFYGDVIHECFVERVLPTPVETI